MEHHDHNIQQIRSYRNELSASPNLLLLSSTPINAENITHLVPSVYPNQNNSSIVNTRKRKLPQKEQLCNSVNSVVKPEPGYYLKYVNNICQHVNILY